MWTFWYPMTSPKLFYTTTARWHALLGGLMFVLLSLGMVWGLVWAPADYQQGDAFRLIYIHVPCALWSLTIYAGMGALAVALLVWRIKLAGIVLLAAAQIGAWLTFLALVTGSLWGKPMWGTWWIWDARLTSELILLFMYIGVLGLGYAHSHRDQAERMAAILTLVGLLDLPIIHYSVRWWSTLHQGVTLSLFSHSKIHASMAYPLWMMIVAVGLYAVWIIFYKTRSEILWRECHQVWVKTLINSVNVNGASHD